MNRDGGAYNLPMTVFWSCAHCQRHVTNLVQSLHLVVNVSIICVYLFTFVLVMLSCHIIYLFICKN